MRSHMLFTLALIGGAAAEPGNYGKPIGCVQVFEEAGDFGFSLDPAPTEGEVEVECVATSGKCCEGGSDWRFKSTDESKFMTLSDPLIAGDTLTCTAKGPWKPGKLKMLPSGNYFQTPCIIDDSNTTSTSLSPSGSEEKKWGKFKKQCLDKMQKKQKSNKCCREFGMACVKPPKFECPEDFEPGAYKGNEVAKAKYCCREMNICPVRCSKDLVKNNQTVAEECCTNNGVCVDDGKALEKDKKRDQEERKAGKKKKALKAMFKNSFETLKENPKFVLRILRRAIMEKSKELRGEDAGTKFYISMIGRTLADGSFPGTPEDIMSHTVAITRDMNDEVEMDDDAFVNSVLAALLSRGARTLQVGEVEGDDLFFEGELMGTTDEDVNTAFAELKENSATESGDYGIPFTKFTDGAAGPSEDDNDDGMAGWAVVLLSILGVVVVGLVGFAVVKRRNGQLQKNHAGVLLDGGAAPSFAH
eukprot:TRINITY_DN6931_c2_g1_i2.p1 TRINITY_DN6931_c2_g1~~TRINITY_DN6931_c2_g1_i2.p1  ORF type:complete len:473 (+),score=126.64 TRINITY_DN6931_c2_g1_i2:43-1461(+)